MHEQKPYCMLPLYTVEIPPAIYDHPFPGRVTTSNHFLYEIPKYCDRWQIACAPIGINHAETCHIHILTPGQDGVTLEFYLKLKRHEEAHCNGWPADHRGALSTDGD
jgi:hypothetical protein